MPSSSSPPIRRFCWAFRQIMSFDDGQIHEISYEETQPFQIVSSFVTRRKQMLNELFRQTPSLFDDVGE